MTAPRSRARWLFRAFVVVAWLAVVALGLEAWARWTERRIPDRNPLVADLLADLERWSEADQTLWSVPYWSYRPSAELRVEFDGRLYHVRTNHVGLRGPEVELPKPPDVYRIVCVGGSTTVGGWTDETTYPAFLEGALRDRFPEARIEVVNAGVSGLTSQGELRKVRDYLALEPDLIVEYNLVNDVVQIHSSLWAREHGPLARLLASSTFARTRLSGLFRPSPERIASTLRTTTLSNLAALRRAARDAGVEIAFASFAAPDPARLDAADREFLDHNVRHVWGMEFLDFDTYLEVIRTYNRLLEESCAASGTPYVPVAENLNKGVGDYIDICHLETDAQREKAEIVAAHLEPHIAAALAARSAARP